MSTSRARYQSQESAMSAHTHVHSIHTGHCACCMTYVTLDESDCTCIPEPGEWLSVVAEGLAILDSAHAVEQSNLA